VSEHAVLKNVYLELLQLDNLKATTNYYASSSCSPNNSIPHCDTRSWP